MPLERSRFARSAVASAPDAHTCNRGRTRLVIRCYELCVRRRPWCTQSCATLRGRRLAYHYLHGARARVRAHAHGLVYRDVKPGNVLFMADGTPVLSDFGLAKLVGMQAGITNVGTVLGSAEYMSP